MKRTWRPNTRARGQKIPANIQERTRQRVLACAEEHFAGKYARLDIRFRGEFCYIDAYQEPELPAGFPWPGCTETPEEYLDRLRGTPIHLYRLRYLGSAEDFWERKRREYRAREAELMRALEQHQKANTFYFDAGVRVLRLAEKAYELWLAQPQTEKRRLLDTLLLNCTFDGENLDATYRKPFCWLAEGPVRSIWRAVRDDFANWFQAEECLEVAHLDG